MRELDVEEAGAVYLVVCRSDGRVMHACQDRNSAELLIKSYGESSGLLAMQWHPIWRVCEP